DENSLDCAPSKPDLAEQRQEFRGLSNKVYFNFGGQGTLPKAGLEAIIDTYNFLQQKGPFSGQVNDWISKKTELLRQEMAQELGISPSNLSITEDVTVGCNIALWGVDWQAGEHILLTDCEHPGIIATVREIARRYHLEISTCPIRETLNDGNPIEVISAHLRPKTRVLVVSHVLWNTGQVLPLKEIS
ncbi:MAG: aminotransferase class V-fold PLP-dependent enzyme, partial [Microcystis panniformis]